jgi:hypothetical protein
MEEEEIDMDISCGYLQYTRKKQNQFQYLLFALIWKLRARGCLKFNHCLSFILQFFLDT